MAESDFNINIRVDPRQARRGTQAVERGLDDVSDSAQGARRSIRGIGDSLTRALGPMRAFAGAAAGAFAIANIDNLKSEIIGLAALSGISVQEFQKISAAFQSVGFEARDTADFLKDINDRVGDFVLTGAGPFVDAFEQILKPLGMTKDSLLELSSTEVMQSVANGMDTLGFSIQKQTFIMESLSSESTKLLPLLKDNGKAIKEISRNIENKGLILTPTEVTALREANVLISQMGATVKTAFTKFTGIVANSIDEIQSLVFMLSVQFARYAIPAAITALSTLSVAIMANPIGAMVTVLVIAISYLVGFADKIKVSSDGLVTLQDVGIAVFENIGRAVKFMKGVFDGVAGAIFIAWREIPAKLENIFIGMFNALSATLTDFLNDAVHKINNLSKAIKRLSFGKIDITLIADFTKLEIDAVKGGRNIGEKMAIAIQDSISDAMKGESVFVPTAVRAREISVERRIEAQKRRIEAQKSLFQTQYHPIQILEKKVETTLPKIEKNIEDFANRTENLVNNAFQGMEDALVSFVSTGKLDFKDLANSIISDLARIAIKQTIIEPLKTMFTSGGGSDFLSSLFGFRNGGPVMAAAGGAISGPGGPRSDAIPAYLSDGEYVVNSASTKRFLPLLNAINNGNISSGGGGVPVVQIIDQRTSGDANDIETKETPGKDGKKILQVIISDTVKRDVDNGLLDSSLQSRYGIKRGTAMRG